MPTIRGLFALLVLDAAILSIAAWITVAPETSWLLAKLLPLQGESSLLAWYPSIKYIVAAQALVILALQSPNAWPDRAALWCLIAMFVLMSADEPVGIHEALQASLSASILEGRFSEKSDDVIAGKFVVGAIGGLVVAFCVGRFAYAFRGNRHVWASAAAGAALLVAGAVFVDLLVEIISAPERTMDLFLILEEVLETFGASFLLYGIIAAFRTDPALFAMGSQARLISPDLSRS